VHACRPDQAKVHKKRRLPDKLNRHSPLSRDIWEAREQVLGDLIDHYGHRGKRGNDLLYGLIASLCEDFIPAYTHPGSRPGAKRQIDDPNVLYFVVDAIRYVAKENANPVRDAQLKSLVDRIATDIRSNRRRAGIASVCKLLSREKGPWYRQKPETLRANYNEVLANRRAFKAAADAALAGLSSAGPE
jgi:hypothetical protein